ncbi:hypothetical protein HRF87_24460 [Bacillus sp. CRN 9]|nr:hypothetical protein [Bacillus sp. CRN 9]
MKNYGIRMNLPCIRKSTEQHDRISFCAEYMRDALEAHFKLNSENLNMWFAGAFRSFILDDDKQVKTFILPVRS